VRSLNCGVGKIFGRQFGPYVGWAVAFGVISSGVKMLSRRELPVASPGLGDGHAVVEREGENLKGCVTVEEREEEHGHGERPKVETKSLYMSAGSGIPEIKVRAQCSRDT
jgi:chloride channel 3/4/5